MPDRISHVVESDLLIIGGGSAGLWAAKRFTELMPEKKVVIVDKGPKKDRKIWLLAKDAQDMMAKLEEIL